MKTMRAILLFWTLFIGIGALAGSLSMLIEPDGSILHMESLLPYFSVLPLSRYLFQDYTFPGIALLLVNCVPNLVASHLILRKKESGIVLGVIQGIVLMLWITIQFVIFPFNFLSTSYFIFGILQAISGFMAYVFNAQEKMVVKKEDYRGIGSRGKDLVVFYSRLGYTRRIAYEIASETGGVVEELKAKERTEGTLGFWWCGRFGMHSMAMEIENPLYDPSQFESVIICTPIWVFGPSGPAIRYLEMERGKIDKLHLVMNHFNTSFYMKAARLLEKKAGMKAESIRSFVSRIGRTIGECRNT